jgi:hypothetical protein
MLKSTAYLCGFLVVGLAFFVATERMVSPAFQQCIDKRTSEKVSNPANNKPASLRSVVSATVGCSGDFVDSHGSGITALATLMIAAFIWILWIATTKQSEFAREAHILDKRAFIFAIDFAKRWDVPDPATAGLYNWRFAPLWRNTGDTATKDLTTFVECEIRNDMLPPNYPFTFKQEHVVKGIIGPKVDMVGGTVPRVPAVITPEDLREAQLFRRFIYLWGWVKYFDVFPGTPRHITHFCWLITSTGDPMTFIPNTPGSPPTPGTLNFAFLQHPEGNYNKDET